MVPSHPSSSRAGQASWEEALHAEPGVSQPMVGDCTAECHEKDGEVRRRQERYDSDDENEQDEKDESEREDQGRETYASSSSSSLKPSLWLLPSSCRMMLSSLWL